MNELLNHSLNRFTETLIQSGTPLLFVLYEYATDTIFQWLCWKLVIPAAKHTNDLYHIIYSILYLKYKLLKCKLYQLRGHATSLWKVNSTEHVDSFTVTLSALNESTDIIILGMVVLAMKRLWNNHLEDVFICTLDTRKAHTHSKVMTLTRSMFGMSNARYKCARHGTRLQHRGYFGLCASKSCSNWNEFITICAVIWNI